MIPPDKVREVAERLSIVDVISEYMPLRRSGSNFTGLCPFHGEKTPSFNVNPAREIFHCFGCGAGGDLFAFVMRIEGISFPEAIKKLAGRAGVLIEERPLTAAEQQAKSEREEQRSILSLAASHYRDILTGRPEGAPGRDYLLNRKVEPGISAAYGIGYAPERRDTLVHAIRSGSHSLEIAASLGLIRKGDRGNWYDLLHSRLIFPIRDSQGQPIAFAGRVLDNSLPKYINSPESPIYRKSNTLFGIDLALRDIRLSKSAILVEGYFDHLAIYRAGIKNVVATCGTALTEGHTALLGRHAEKLYLLFDGDNAGRKAAVRGMELCLEQRLPVYLVTMPNGEDPDSFLSNNDVEAFSERLEKARPAFEQFIHWLLAKTPPDNVDNRVRLLDEIVPRFRRISDPVERDLYEKEICRLLGLDVGAFRKRLASERMQEPRRIKDTSTPVAKTAAAPAIEADKAQETLLGLLAEYDGVRKEALRAGIGELFDEMHLPLAEALLEEADKNVDGAEPSPLWPRVFARLEGAESREMAARLLFREAQLSDIDWQTALRQCLHKRKRQRMSELKHIALKLSSITPEHPEYEMLLQKANELRKQKSKI